MNIDHIGLYVSDLDGARAFFEKYFGATANEKYVNAKKGFVSHFLTGAEVSIQVKAGFLEDYTMTDAIV